MELKVLSLKISLKISLSFNRTFMELKELFASQTKKG